MPQRHSGQPQPADVPFEEYGVKQLTSTRIVAFQENSVVVEGPDGRQELPADTMIAAFGTKPNNAGGGCRL